MVSPEPVISFLSHFSYIGVFSSIVVSGYILPVPEEIVLLTIGYLSSSGMFNIYFVTIVSFLATLGSDIFLYLLAKKDSKLTANLKVRMHKNPFVKSWMKKPNDIGRAVFMMRFFVGLRFLGPILAGAMNVPLKKFIFYDTLALLLYTPFFVLIGFAFHNSFLRMVTRVESIRYLLFFLAVGVISFFLLRLASKKLSSIGISEKPIIEEETE
jgi:membrane protein DedA with SNARE-associated domain